MKTTPPAAFRSIGAPLDVADADLDQISDKLGVPTLVKPAHANATRPSARQDPAEAESPAPDVALQRVVSEKLTIELPGYLTDAMKRKALDDRTTLRHVVMLALKTAGFYIAGSDMVPDARRARSKRH